MDEELNHNLEMRFEVCEDNYTSLRHLYSKLSVEIELLKKRIDNIYSILEGKK